MGNPLWHGGSSSPQRVPWRLVPRVWGVAALSRRCWAILAPSTATGETCGHGGSETLVCRLDRPTVCGLIVDDDRGARGELVPDLRDFGREWDFVDTIVGPLARDERFDDAAQGFRTQHAVRNHHRRDASLLRTAPPSWRSRRCWHGSRGEMDPSHAGRGPEAFPPEHASHPHPISSRERSAAPPACSP